MPETPFQFRHQGQLAGLRTAVTPVEPQEPSPAATWDAPPRPRRRAWRWLAVPCVVLVAAVPWLSGIDARSVGPVEISFPVSSMPGLGDDGRAQSSASVAAGADAVIAGDGPSPRPSSDRVEPVLQAAAPASEAQRTVTPASRSPVSAGRSRLATSSPAKPRDVQIDLSIVKVRYSDGRLAPTVITALTPALPAIRNCLAPILRGQPELKGTVIATISARDGKISAVNVESGIRHTRLRFCFRQALMSRPVSVGAVEPAFDARVEFFVLPRVIR